MPIFHFTRTVRAAVALFLRLTCACLTLVALASCSKNESRYDRAMELAKSYSFGDLPEELAAPFRGSEPKGNVDFESVITHNSFKGRFKEAATKVLKEQFVQDGNSYLLKGIVDSLGQRCFRAGSVMTIMDCNDYEFAFYIYSLQLFHTKEGDFIYSVADIDRGNSNSSNENASMLVLIVDPKDGSLGIIIEDKLAVSGGRPDLMAAVLTLASSVTRVQESTPKGKSIQLSNVRYDLEAAKAGKLYSKPVGTQEDEIPDSQSETSDSEEHAEKPTFTKEQLKDVLFGKTPEEVRALLGPPSNVSETSDGLAWFYWSDQLTVTDPLSGTAVNSSDIWFGRAPYAVRNITF